MVGPKYRKADEETGIGADRRGVRRGGNNKNTSSYPVRPLPPRDGSLFFSFSPVSPKFQDTWQLLLFLRFFSLVCLFRLTSPRLTLGFIYKCLLVFSFAVEIMPEETKLDVILKSSRPFVLRGCKVPTFTQFSPLSLYNLSLVAHTRDD